MSGIGIITNPNSKLNKRNPQRSKTLGFILGEQGEIAQTQSLSELDQVMGRFRDKGIEVLAINGGDGTISRTISAMIHAYGSQPYPKVAILKGGTINMLAQNLRIKGTPESLLYALINEYGAAKPLPTLSLRCLKIGRDYGFLFGNGTVSSFLEKFYENKTGALGSLMLIANIIGSAIVGGRLARKVLHDHFVRLLIDGEAPVSTHSVAVLASTVPELPLGPRFFPEAGPGRDKMQVVLMTVSARNAPFLIPLTAIFSPSRDDYAKISFTAGKVKIQSPTIDSYTLDGELHAIPDRELCVETGPSIEFVAIGEPDGPLS